MMKIYMRERMFGLALMVFAFVVLFAGVLTGHDVYAYDDPGIVFNAGARELSSENSLLKGNLALRFDAKGKFKIVQFTDTHIIPGKPESEAAFENIAHVLDAEKPDLVVFTGDIVTGRPAAKGWEKVATEVVTRNIPFAVVFGNHDDEQDMTREQLAAMIGKMPGCLLVPKVKGVYGYGNYVLEIKSSDDAGSAALIYCMDSNAYTPIEGVGKYGWFKADQVNWYRAESAEQNKRNGVVLPALAFFHIPLPEYKEAYMNEKHPSVGNRSEDECGPVINTGMFAAMLEMGDVMGTFTGHDHVNDYVAYLHGIVLAYGRFSGGKTTYGELPNGARVIELTEGERAFSTWIRTREGEVLMQVRFPDNFQPAQ